MEQTMPTLVDELTARARALSPEERIRLAENLLSTIEDEPPSAVEADWDRAILARVEEIRSGRAVLVPAEDVHARARRLYE